ncbi:TPA: hypothetical protein DCR49_10500 [Candidatus Delongbacteria bacterium]|nr:hypothetical protein [Candidatus Delongbacteria bacterium]
MKNKILNLAFLIFSLLLPTHAQTGWSDPVSVSGIYWCTDPAISVDNNGVLSAFWLKHIKLDVGYYSTVYFSQSFNGGLNWTAPVNITPESTSVLWETRAVTDLKNNIHIIYAKGLESKVLVYKKYDGVSWTVDYVIDISLNVNMRFDIDNTDMLFATWTLGSTTYYMYCDSNIYPLAWSVPKKIHPDINYQTFGFIFDKNNDIYAIGKNDTDTSIGSCVYEYNKIEDKWYNFEQVYDFGEMNLGCAITLSQNDSLYTNTAVGSSMLFNNDFLNQKYIQDSTWAIPVNINSKNNDWNKKMFVDAKNIIHVFEVNIENDIHSLNHTYGKGASWQTETIHTDPDYYIPWFDVKRKVFEEYDEYYVLYGKSGNINGTPTSRINFQTKRISTGIENSENIPESTVLYQNYPNPFNNSTEISYSINNPANVKISIFNTKGEFIQNLINKKQTKGQQSAIFNAVNLNSGIYYYQLEIGGHVKDTRKMLYLK